MKKFEIPEIEIVELLVQDVVTSSDDYIIPGENEFPLG